MQLMVNAKALDSGEDGDLSKGSEERRKEMSRVKSFGSTRRFIEHFSNCIFVLLQG